MDKYGIATGHDEDFGKPARITMHDCPNEWSIWGDFKEFSAKTGIPIAAFTEELRFDLRD